MKIKADFITNSSSVNYTIVDTQKIREKLIVVIEGISFNLFKELKFKKFEKIQDLIDDSRSPGNLSYDMYLKLIKSGKIVYEAWTNGEGSLIGAYLYRNNISGNELPEGVEWVDIYLGG
jgi:hypothetical protein